MTINVLVPSDYKLKVCKGFNNEEQNVYLYSDNRHSYYYGFIDESINIYICR